MGEDIANSNNTDSRSLRYRINVATSVKGVKTWDCTVDGEGFTLSEILEKSSELVKSLEQKYPIEL
jgi:hypothetical protein